MAKRFKIVPHYLARVLGISPHPAPPVGEVVGFLFQPGMLPRGLKHIESRRDEGDYLVAKVRGMSKEIYVPKSFPLRAFAGTVDEAVRDAHWHQYIKQGVTLEPKEVVIDCGAAEGLFTRRALDAGCKVYAVEPLPAFQAALERSFAGEEGFALLPYAAGHHSAEAKFEEDGIGSGISQSGSIEVGIRPLDDLLIEKEPTIGMIKADVEGFEYDLLLGAENILKRDKPKLALTVYHHENNVPQIRRFLELCRPDYNICTRGIASNGNPVMLLAW